MDIGATIGAANATIPLVSTSGYESSSWEVSYPSADTSGVVVVAADRVASVATTTAPSRGTWNRHLRGIVEAWADPDRGRAALYTRGAGISGSRLAFAKWVMCKGAATLMDANSLGGLSESTINYSSILVHGLTGRIEDKLVTPDVHGLMSVIRAQTALANNVIVVAHSQGNLLLSNALAKYNRHFGVPGVGTGCVGAVSLASPQKRALFPIEPTRLKGTTMRWEDDMLWQLMLPNDFEFKTSRIASAALQTLSHPYYATRPTERELRRKLFGLDIHEVDRNYFRDVVVTPVVQTYLREVYAACNP